ncbi:MAG: hypothetical protein U0229_10830 [Anaeromyxobacter sp.]
MKPCLLALASVTTLLGTGCPSAYPLGHLEASHALGERPRIHSWAFVDDAQDPELDLARTELRRRLAAAGWLEAPLEQAELQVEVSLEIGEPEWVDGTPPILTLIEVVGAIGAATQGQEPEEHEPWWEKAWPKGFGVRMIEPLTGHVEYEGWASASDRAPTATRMTGRLARALLGPFPGPARKTWTAALPPYPAPGADEKASPLAQTSALALPPRVACKEAVPVAVLRSARFRDAPDAEREVAFRTKAVLAGCASVARNGLTRVALSDGRAGFVASTSVLFHPGP